jgi:hypothetical protein
LSILFATAITGVEFPLKFPTTTEISEDPTDPTRNGLLDASVNWALKELESASKMLTA